MRPLLVALGAALLASWTAAVHAAEPTPAPGAAKPAASAPAADPAKPAASAPAADPVQPAASAPDPAPPDGVLVLVLCEGQVAGADVLPPPRPGAPFGLAVRLTPEATRAFEELTRDQVGRELEIRLDAGHVVRAPIRGPIRSGLITTAGYADRDAAEAARAAALASRERPCPEPGPASTP